MTKQEVEKTSLDALVKRYDALYHERDDVLLQDERRTIFKEIMWRTKDSGSI